MIKIEKVKIEDVKLNPSNPRTINDSKFEKLVRSIKEFPKMLEIRPIVVDNNMMVLGGNMRFKACVEAGLKEVFIIKTSDLTEEQQKEFIVKDNIGYGEWDWELINHDDMWDLDKLADWGLDVVKFTDLDPDDFFEEALDNDDDNKITKIFLEYTSEDFKKFTDLIGKYSGTKESIILKLLEDKV